MSVFFVFQNRTYTAEHAEERKAGYVWAPQVDKAKAKNAGYTTMTRICKGDIILHSSKGRLRSISIAKDDCYESKEPDELKTSNHWSEDGYRVDVEYHDLDHPLNMVDERAWLAAHYEPNSAFTINGIGKQQYMCDIAPEHAIHLLKAALEKQTNEDLKNFLSEVLNEITDDNESEYDLIEKEQINELLDEDADSIPEWSGIKEPQALVQSGTTGRDKPKRDAKRAADALKRAGYQCEYNETDRTFPRKNGLPYTEPHHLIPISKYQEFPYSLDVMENIVSLCSHCHNLLHYGRIEDKKPILKKLYDERIEALRACRLDLTFEQLMSYYQ